MTAGVGDKAKIVSCSLSKSKSSVHCNSYITNIIHQLCTTCMQKKEKEYAGLLVHACDLCWKQKKSCMNGGR